jgi:hypothetical protein
MRIDWIIITGSPGRRHWHHAENRSAAVDVHIGIVRSLVLSTATNKFWRVVLDDNSATVVIAIIIIAIGKRFQS